MSNIIELTNEKEQEVLMTYKNTKDLSDIINQAMIMQKCCKDYVVNSNSMFVDGDLDLALWSENKAFEFTQHSFSQLCGKLGVPVRYMKKCLKEGQERLVPDNINKWLSDIEPKKFLVRTYGESARGILSDKYSVMDTPDILTSLADVTDDFRVKSYFMDEERLHVRMIGEQLNVPKEDLFCGLQIDSSDVGRKLLTVQFFVYKQVCTNGLVVPKLNSTIFEQKHIGITQDEFIRGFKENIDVLPDLVAKVEEFIEHGRKSIITDAKELGNIIEKTIKDLKLPEKSDDKILELLNTNYSNTRWGVVNSLTEFAQEFTLERRLEIERYAGNLLVA